MTLDINLLIQLLPIFGSAVIRTVTLVIAGLAGGLLLGFVLLILRETRNPVLGTVYWTYVAILRGVPFLIHLFVIYFGLPVVGISLDPFMAAAIALSLYGAAYFAEIFRGCWQGISKGQIEAARCMGLSRHQVFLNIECPQALRAAVPLIVNQTVLLMKESALASVITYPELTMTAGKVVSEQFVYLEPYLMLALSYWLLAVIIQRLGSLLRKRIAD